jgi:uncharacterized membrane protein
MRRFLVRLLALVLLVVILPLSAFAQRTGGSFGGRSWGSGRSSSSSSSSRSSSGSSWGSSRSSGTSWGSSGGSYGGGSYGTYGGGGGGGGSNASGGEIVCVLGCVLAFFIIIFLLGSVLGKKKDVGNISYTPPPMDPNDTFSLGALAIAFDSTARAQVQGELDRISQALQLQDSPEALNGAAAQMAQCLARFLDAAYMTHFSLSEGVSMDVAQQQFDQAVNAERGRYLIETVRNDAGGVRKVNAPASRARAEEGGGFVVVTVLVARRGRFPGFRPPTDRPTLQGDLQILLAGAGAIQALEVVWVPSDPNDVMSSAEMAVKFPTLKPIAPDARVGRRACAYCKTVFAAELPQCPNCGAPAQ